MPTPWTDLPSHRRWLDTECSRLLDFGAGLRHPLGGAGWLDDDGRPDLARGPQTYLTARAVHVFCLASLLGRPGARPLATWCLAGLQGPLRDHEHGGWVPGTDTSGVQEPGKTAYDHAFVVLAGASATTAGLEGGRALLDDALRVLDERFWDERAGMVLDAWDTAWTAPDPYRGMNANMHTVEALLAAADATADPSRLRPALRIAERAVRAAQQQEWRLPEHFDADWEPQLEHSADTPDDPFRPYGATVGHALEWSRLLLHLEAALGPAAPDWLLPSAIALADRAVEDGWAADGSDGFVYTTDWHGRPVVRDRMHWVAAEAVAAAAALHRRTGQRRWAERYARWWDHVAEVFVDRERGSWHHQLGPDLRPATSVWHGKPDLYHAVQATLLARAPLAPSLAAALAEGRLEGLAPEAAD